MEGTSERERRLADPPPSDLRVEAPRRTRTVPALLRLVCIVVGGFLYGYLTANLPAPDDPDVFWLGNLAAPAGLLSPRRDRARYGPTRRHRWLLAAHHIDR